VAGRYERESKILQGRFSAIYGAYDREARQYVFLRRLEGPALGREARQHLLREGRFLARLEHQNLPRFLDFIDDTADLYVVMEAFAGTSLTEVLQKSKLPLSVKAWRSYFEQFLSVLGFLHGQNPPLIQRDLRPENIMSTRRGVLKLLDFGLARLKDSAYDPRETSFRGLGDPVYAAFEQLIGEASAADQDLYAVGSILYYLGSGDTPPRAKDRWEGSANDVPLSELRQDLPALWVEVAEWMRQPEQCNRPESVAQVLQRLQAGE